jgi:F0F1-type ATP synthase assembly protein I
MCLVQVNFILFTTEHSEYLTILMNKFHKGPNEERSPNVIATLYFGETVKIYFLFLCTYVSLRVTNSIPSCINFSNVSP